MRTPFDQLAKAVAQYLFEPFGGVYAQEEVASEVQYIDTWFKPEPRPDVAEVRAKHGLFGRIAVEACLLEFFHQAPSLHEIQDCISKQHQLARVRARKAANSEQRRPPLPRLWIFSAGRPNTVIKRYELRAMPDWPRGFYAASDGLALSLVVLRELPIRRDTLILRLLGAGNTFIRAIRELAGLSADSWERQFMVPLLLAFRINSHSYFSSDDVADDEESMSYLHELQAIYADWEAKTLAKGRQEGRTKLEGILLKQLTLKFGAVPDAGVERVRAASDEELERWAERILTADTLTEVFAEP